MRSVRAQIAAVLRRGLLNLGEQSCFMNASLQALLAVPAVPAELAAISQEHAPGGPFSAAHALAALASQLQGEGPAVEPQAFYDQLWPKESRRASQGETAAPTGTLGGEYLRQQTQCDAVEFVNKLLGCLSREGRAELHALFVGTRLSTVRCSGCKQAKRDPSGALSFTFLTLPIDTPEKRVSIDAALESYLKGVDLTGENKYACEAPCDRRCDATQQLELCSLPRVLMLQLERFGGSQTKNQEHVPLEETLTVKNHEHELRVEEVRPAQGQPGQ